MSCKPPPTGTYRIVSLISGPRQGTGIYGELRAGVDFNVYNNADYIVWNVTQQSDPWVYRFALKDIRPYTGEKDHKHVIVTERADEDREWRLRYYEEHDAYSIELNPFRPSLGWTVASEEPFSAILVEAFVVPSRHQLFRFVKYDRE